MSYLYILKCQEFYKIGIANDVASRLATLQVGNPYPIEPYAYYKFDNPLPIEQSLHQRFGNLCQSGEWFSLSDEHLRLIEQICSLLGGEKQQERVEVTDEKWIDSQITDDEVGIPEGEWVGKPYQTITLSTTRRNGEANPIRYWYRKIRLPDGTIRSRYIGKVLPKEWDTNAREA